MIGLNLLDRCLEDAESVAAAPSHSASDLCGKRSSAASDSVKPESFAAKAAAVSPAEANVSFTCLFRCSICHDNFMTEPAVLTCGHWFCRECVKAWLLQGSASSNNKVCPLCRAPTTARSPEFCPAMQDIITLLKKAKIGVFARSSSNNFAEASELSQLQQPSEHRCAGPSAETAEAVEHMRALRESLRSNKRREQNDDDDDEHRINIEKRNHHDQQQLQHETPHERDGRNNKDAVSDAGSVEEDEDEDGETPSRPRQAEDVKHLEMTQPLFVLQQRDNKSKNRNTINHRGRAEHKSGENAARKKKNKKPLESATTSQFQTQRLDDLHATPQLNNNIVNRAGGLIIESSPADVVVTTTTSNNNNNNDNTNSSEDAPQFTCATQKINSSMSVSVPRESQQQQHEQNIEHTQQQPQQQEEQRATTPPRNEARILAESSQGRDVSEKGCHDSESPASVSSDATSSASQRGDGRSKQLFHAPTLEFLCEGVRAQNNNNSKINCNNIPSNNRSQQQEQQQQQSLSGTPAKTTMRILSSHDSTIHSDKDDCFNMPAAPFHALNSNNSNSSSNINNNFHYSSSIPVMQQTMNELERRSQSCSELPSASGGRTPPIKLPVSGNAHQSFQLQQQPQPPFSHAAQQLEHHHPNNVFEFLDDDVALKTGSCGGGSSSERQQQLQRPATKTSQHQHQRSMLLSPTQRVLLGDDSLLSSMLPQQQQQSTQIQVSQWREFSSDDSVNRNHHQHHHHHHRVTPVLSPGKQQRRQRDVGDDDDNPTSVATITAASSGKKNRGLYTGQLSTKFGTQLVYDSLAAASGVSSLSSLRLRPQRQPALAADSSLLSASDRQNSDDRNVTNDAQSTHHVRHEESSDDDVRLFNDDEDGSSTNDVMFVGVNNDRKLNTQRSQRVNDDDDDDDNDDVILENRKLSTQQPKVASSASLSSLSSSVSSSFAELQQRQSLRHGSFVPRVCMTQPIGCRVGVSSSNRHITQQQQQMQQNQQTRPAPSSARAVPQRLQIIHDADTEDDGNSNGSVQELRISAAGNRGTTGGGTIGTQRLPKRSGDE